VAEDDSKQWSHLIDKNCSQNTRINRKLNEKRDKELIEEKIRGERELNRYVLTTDHKSAIESQDRLSGDGSSDGTSVKKWSTGGSLSERNAINARLLKAELMGNDGLVCELKAKLKQLDESGSDCERDVTSQSTQSTERLYSVEKRANEESMSLKEMYLRAKQSTTDDETKRYVASTSRVSRYPEEEYEDMRTKNKRRKHESMPYMRHESEGKDNCRQCVHNIERQLIVVNGEKTLICLTPFEPFVSGFCHILSKSHSNMSTISADEECLLEMNERKHEICKYFDKRHNKSVVFMETYLKRSHTNRHLTVECIPIKSKYESEAKIFFKKAIMECESEWALNKQLIEIKDKPITRLIPKGLSYFWVTFGPKNIGFAHVIENEDSFSRHFGKEVIAGLLDIEPNKWLNSKNQSYDQQFQRVVDFKNNWKKAFA